MNLKYRRNRHNFIASPMYTWSDSSRITFKSLRVMYQDTFLSSVPDTIFINPQVFRQYYDPPPNNPAIYFWDHNDAEMDF